MMWGDVKEKTIYIVGPSSTGKTTLCNALAKKLDLPETQTISEVARQVMATQGFTRKDVGSMAMQQAIMEAQLEQEASRRTGLASNPILICDRSAIDPIVYAVMTSLSEGEAQSRRDVLIHSPAFQLALQKYHNSAFILLAPVAEWVVDDGVRLTESQEECFNIFRTLLKDLDINFRVLGPETRCLEERVVFAMGLLGL